MKDNTTSPVPPSYRFDEGFRPYDGRDVFPQPTFRQLDKAKPLPTDSQERKDAPMARGLLDYFPDALFAVAALSKDGNDKHNPGEEMHWAREKSADHADCIVRHLAERGTVDTDGHLHDTKVAWRALAMLQLAIERQRNG